MKVTFVIMWMLVCICYLWILLCGTIKINGVENGCFIKRVLISLLEALCISIFICLPIIGAIALVIFIF